MLIPIEVDVVERRGPGELNSRSHSSGQFAGSGVAVLRQSTKSKAAFTSFAQKIRERTQDGWELIDAVYEVFQRAREAQKDQLILDSATWLADRGFGKPVQVGQLLDGEGNAVAYQLWTPASQQVETITIDRETGHILDAPALFEPSAESLAAPPVTVEEKRDAYGYGPARAWGVGEPDPRIGE